MAIRGNKELSYRNPVQTICVVGKTKVSLLNPAAL